MNYVVLLWVEVGQPCFTVWKIGTSVLEKPTSIFRDNVNILEISLYAEFLS
jgi:hypothetical protein